MASCVAQMALENTTPPSDKLYVAQIQEFPVLGSLPAYQCICYYGRRGSRLKEEAKGSLGSESSALAEMDKVVAAKLKKGYTPMPVATGAKIIGMPAWAPMFGGASSTPVPTGVAATPRMVVGRLPMLAAVLPSKELSSTLADDRIAVQQKFDGERMLVELSRAHGAMATNKLGALGNLSATVNDQLTGMLSNPCFNGDKKTILDGELMGDRYVVYDVLVSKDCELTEIPYYERFGVMEELFVGPLATMLAPTAWSFFDKTEMVAKALKEDWEGVILRDIDAGYTAGRTLDLLKHKFWATATCRVLANNVKRSIQVGLRDTTGTEVFVGNVTVPVDQRIPEPGTFVEVRYLYAMEGGSLYQPTLIRERDDAMETDLREDLRKAPPEKR